MRLFIANVTVNVVISVLSAAGSRIVPRTDRILYRLAIQPSTFESTKKVKCNAQNAIFRGAREQVKRQTRSVRPAYTSSAVAATKLSWTMA